MLNSMSRANMKTPFIGNPIEGHCVGLDKQRVR